MNLDELILALQKLKTVDPVSSGQEKITVSGIVVDEGPIFARVVGVKEEDWTIVLEVEECR